MGIPTLISTSTASNATSIDITSGIDSTYDEYMFVLTNINPAATSNVTFGFQANAAGGSGYNETVTSTFFYSWNNGGDNGVDYQADHDQAQGTAFQPLTMNMQNSASKHWSGILHLFSPSSTTYVKHFYSTIVASRYADNDTYSFVTHAAGYLNLTTAIDEIQFKPTASNFDGVIQMYGIS